MTTRRLHEGIGSRRPGWPRAPSCREFAPRRPAAPLRRPMRNQFDPHGGPPRGRQPNGRLRRAGVEFESPNCSVVRSTTERLAPVSRRRSTGISPVTRTSQWVGAQVTNGRPGWLGSSAIRTWSARLLDDAAFKRTGDQRRGVSPTERQFAAAEAKPDLGLDEAIDRDGECLDGSRSGGHLRPFLAVRLLRPSHRPTSPSTDAAGSG